MGEQHQSVKLHALEKFSVFLHIVTHSALVNFQKVGALWVEFRLTHLILVKIACHMSLVTKFQLICNQLAELDTLIVAIITNSQ